MKKLAIVLVGMGLMQTSFAIKTEPFNCPMEDLKKGEIYTQARYHAEEGQMECIRQKGHDVPDSKFFEDIRLLKADMGGRFWTQDEHNTNIYICTFHAGARNTLDCPARKIIG